MKQSENIYKDLFLLCTKSRIATNVRSLYNCFKGELCQRQERKKGILEFASKIFLTYFICLFCKIFTSLIYISSGRLHWCLQFTLTLSLSLSSHISNFVTSSKSCFLAHEEGSSNQCQRQKVRQLDLLQSWVNRMKAFSWDNPFSMYFVWFEPLILEDVVRCFFL